MRVLTSRNTRVKLVMGAAQLCLLVVLNVVLCGERKREDSNAACEVNGCGCVAALSKAVDELASTFSVGQHISGRLLMSKLMKRKNYYGERFKLHKHATSLLSWLMAQPKCIFITEPLDGEPTPFPGDGVTIVGAVEAGGMVTVNGMIVPLDKRGRFAVIAKLKPNANRITIRFAKGVLQKEWQINVPVKMDERLIAFEQLCKRAANIGIQLGDALNVLKEAKLSAQSGEYKRSDGQRIDELMRQLQLRLLQTRLGKCATLAASSAQLNSLWELARAFVAAGKISHAERLIEQLESIGETPLDEIPCKIELTRRNGAWCYSISNGYMSAAISQSGGRIVDLRSFDIPLLGREGAVDEFPNGIASKNCVLIVEHASDELVTIKAHTFIGDVEFVRKISMIKGFSSLTLDYHISSRGKEGMSVQWKLRIHPAIGYGDGVGNPIWDRLFIPHAANLPSIVISPGMASSQKRIPIRRSNGLLGAHDSAYRAGLGIAYNDGIMDACLLICGSKYAFEFSPDETPIKLPANGKVEFHLALIPLFGYASSNTFTEALSTFVENLQRRTIKSTPFIGRPNSQ